MTQGRRAPAQRPPPRRHSPGLRQELAIRLPGVSDLEALVGQGGTAAEIGRLDSEIENIDCASPEVAQAIQGLKAALERRAAFASDCIDAAPSVGAARADPLIDFALSCVRRFDPDGRRRAEADSALGDLRARRGDDANPITRAGVALLSDVQSNAIIALLLAVFVDLLVLLRAIVGRHAGTSERVRAIDEITRTFRPSPDLERFEAIYELPADRNLRRIVDDVVTLLFRENLATYLSGNDSSRIGLLKGARERLAAGRAHEQGETIAVLRPLQPGSRDRPALPPRRTIRNPG
jgi:hypothetical protein